MLCVIISVLCCARRVADCALCAQKGKSLTGKSTLWVSKKNWRSFLFCFTITYLVERRAIQIASGCFCKILGSFILNSTSWMRLPLWNARTSLWQKKWAWALREFSVLRAVHPKFLNGLWILKLGGHQYFPWNGLFRQRFNTWNSVELAQFLQWFKNIFVPCVFGVSIVSSVACLVCWAPFILRPGFFA